MDTGLTEDKARHHANIWAAHAQIMAPILGEKPQDFLDRVKITEEQSYDGSIFKKFILDKRNVYGQPVNDDVDAPVEVVTIEPRFANYDVSDIITGKESSKFKKELAGVYKNKETGWDIKLTATGVKHAINSATSRGIMGIDHIEALANLPAIIENMALIETHDDRYSGTLKNMHRFYLPVKVNENVYAVKLTVKEYNKEFVAEVDDIYKLYDLSLVKKMPEDLIANPPHSNSTLASTELPTSGIPRITIREMLESVKDHKGNLFINSDGTVNYKQDENPNSEYYQNSSLPRGLIRFNPKTQEAMITVFKDKKDFSTILHETSHYFLQTLANAYQMENAPAWVKENFETLAREMGFDPNKPLSTETHERFARLGEAYFREGKAPREELAGAFSMFKGWLTSLYRYVSKLLGKDKLNDEIRGVFDRLLVTEEEIAQTQRKEEKENAVKQLVEVFGLSKEQADLLQKEQVKANKKASALILLNEIQGLKDAEDTARQEVKELISNNEFYKAIEKLQKQKVNFESLLGFLEEDTANRIREKWQEVFADNENVLSLDDAAGYYNTSAENLINLFLNELPAKEYEDRYIQKQAPH